MDWIGKLKTQLNGRTPATSRTQSGSSATGAIRPESSSSTAIISSNAAVALVVQNVRSPADRAARNG
jgi:hypothetical protein